MERTCRSLCDLQVGTASAEDEDCLLQGCKPAWRLSDSVVHFPRIYVSSEESAGEGRSSVCLLPARDQSESADVHQPVHPALGSSPSQRQVPARFGQDVQSVHRRLDQLLRSILPDAPASDPQEDHVYVIRWARRKYKRLRHKTKGARDWFEWLRRANPTLFAHWQLCHGNGRTSGAV